MFMLHRTGAGPGQRKPGAGGPSCTARVETFSKPNGIPSDLHLLSLQGRVWAAAAWGETGTAGIATELKPASFLTWDQRARFDLCGIRVLIRLNGPPPCRK